jgi:hypothetical protein
MRAGIIVAAGFAFAVGGCAGGKPQVASDLNVALDVAAVAEGAYAARPNADPKTVAQLARLLAVAQAAVTSWQASTLPEDQALASAAVAALVEYEASAGVAP